MNTQTKSEAADYSVLDALRISQVLVKLWGVSSFVDVSQDGTYLDCTVCGKNAYSRAKTALRAAGYQVGAYHSHINSQGAASDSFAVRR